ncbi:MAG: glycosyltransferase family 4 protein [Chloroflexota bacterium]|nr:glycosyltransferase family 4 protein [Chloroflexota bacterium]
MLIGIDASRAIGAAPTGTETYSRELTRALLALDRRNFFRLYTRDHAPREFFSASSNFEIRAMPFPRLWTHVRLSCEMLTRAPDALFVPAHVLPLVHPRRSIVTVHDLGHLHFPDAHPRGQRLYHNASTRWNARAAAHLLADSEATRDDLVRFFRVPPEKVTVVYPAYDARLYQPVRDAAVVQATRARLRVDGDYILAIGTVQPRKNYARLIEAFARLEIRDLRLVIVGKRGWLYDAIFARAKELNLQSRISFLDYVPAVDLPALISGARVLAFPSLHEGFGLPVLEAQACGTPVVTSLTSSLPEAAGDGALFVDPLDVDAIAGALQRALTDEAIRSKLIAHGFENVKRFSWEQSARQVLRVIETTL